MHMLIEWLMQLQGGIMIEKKVSTNIFYNVLNQVISLIVPLVLSPYVARVLSADLIGDYSFALANSSYFVLIEGLGFSLYGMLEVAAKREDKAYTSKLFKEIMLAKLMLMSLCLSVYIIIFVVFSNRNTILNMIMILNIISAGIDTTWFLSGQEDFKTNALRNSFVRIVNVVLVLVLVKTKDDFLLYAIIMQASNVISMAAIVPYVQRYLVSARVSLKGVINHTKYSIAYFIPGLINTIFTSTDKSILGALTNSAEVGYYEQAIKITNLCGGVISSISNVILPRVTYLNNKKDDRESRKLLFATIGGACLVSVPTAVGLASVASRFVPFFFGPGYDKCIVLLQILSINVIFSVLSNYVGHQCLISKGKQKEYNIAISTGAMLNLILNAVTATKYQSIGVSLSSTISGVVVVIIIMFYCKGTFTLRELLAISWKYFLASIVMGGVLIIIPPFENLLVDLIIRIISGVMVYLFLLWIFRDALFCMFQQRIRLNCLDLGKL